MNDTDTTTGQPPADPITLTTDVTITAALAPPPDTSRPPAAAGDEVNAEIRDTEVLVLRGAELLGLVEGPPAELIKSYDADPLAHFKGRVTANTEDSLLVRLTLHVPVIMSSLTRLDIEAPPVLARAVGYEGAARLVAIYWTPYGDEVMWTDGVRSMTGNWTAWVTFEHHPYAAPHLEDFNFGNSNEEAEHWLVVDLETNALYVGFPAAAAQVLAAAWQHRALPPPPPLLAAAAGQPPTRLEDEIERLAGGDMSGWIEVSGPDAEAIAQVIERDNRLNSELALWLNARISGEQGDPRTPAAAC